MAAIEAAKALVKVVEIPRPAQLDEICSPSGLH
jgi:hypothetical protein